ncbi:hypothetical protein K443DRAFT_10578 [Laccaria amethystina LaAM-08-1]|uniref:Uncharacterized protein n=1 Tax=Laccaria amethystina LaAM-08-1 TaxID=1095629 RepID=A0A0C9X5G7_9AGAR|nr:hypothetical protein K443DRAFT_10578 [Laccaria amethystina LaAM-08-1]
MAGPTYRPPVRHSNPGTPLSQSFPSLKLIAVIGDIPYEPQQQPLCDTECEDKDEANDLGDQDQEGSATDEDSEPESGNAGSTHEGVNDKDDKELSATVSEEDSRSKKRRD